MQPPAQAERHGIRFSAPDLLVHLDRWAVGGLHGLHILLRVDGVHQPAQRAQHRGQQADI